MAENKELLNFLEFSKEQKRIFTPEEESDLFVRYKNGDLEALEKLVLAYLWIAPEISRFVCQRNNITLSPKHIEEAVNSLRIAMETFPMSESLLKYAETVITERLQLMIHSEKIRFI